MQPSSPGSFRESHFSWRQVTWRGAALVTVFLAGFVGLLSGVEVSERDLSTTNAATKAYYALGLFVMGGLDLGTPQGGPPAGRLLLWLSYFGAPLITASALLEAALHIIAPFERKLRRLDSHVIVGGGGRLAQLYLQKLREREPKTSVVVVDPNPVGPQLIEMRDAHRALLVTGDITSDAVLSRLRLERARQVMLLTGDDFVNLDAAAKIARSVPGLSGNVVAHVSDLGFMHSTAEFNGARECETFNGHEFAAVRLVKEHLLTRFESTSYRDPVVLAGFGRFGQTVLHQLQEHALGHFGTVVIVDFEASAAARNFSDRPGFSDSYERVVMDGDLHDPVLWQQVEEVIATDGHQPVIVVGSGQDGTNLQAALTLIKRHPGAYIIARSFHRSPFGAEVSREAGIHAFNIAQLVREGMPERWFDGGG